MKIETLTKGHFIFCSMMSADFPVKQKFHSFVGVSLDIGDRSTMEDEFCVKMKKNGLSYYGVFDGHAGSLASAFVRENLCNKFFSLAPNNLKNKDKLQKAMTDAHLVVDKEYFSHEEEARKTKHSLYSGTTTVSLVMNSSEGWGFVSNAGDCRAVLFHQGKIVSLSSDHRVNRSGERNSEMDRVESLGGWLQDGLLCGQLEPTRGIGDHDFKSLKSTKFPDGNFKGDLVIPTPEYEWFSLTKDATEISEMTSCVNEISVGLCTDHYSFMVLASDGIWDVMSNCEVLATLSERFKDNQKLTGDLVEQAADELIRVTRLQTRKKNERMDNTTVILIAFAPCNEPGHYLSEESTCQYCSEPSFTHKTESIINSKASSITASKKKKMNRNSKRKKKQSKKRKK